MDWILAKDNRGQLKTGALVCTDENVQVPYEETRARSYGVANDILQGMDYVKALQSIKTSSTAGFAMNMAFITEEGVKYTIKNITPEINMAQSRYSKTNAKSWIIDLGE